MKNILLILLSIFALSSCDRPQCVNDNPIFDTYEVVSEEYKSELANELSTIDYSTLTYWLYKYVNEEDNEYIIVNIQNDSLCAKAKIEVSDWIGLEGYRKAKGISYTGAEVKGFKFDVVQNESGTHFIYKSLDAIID